MLKVNSFFNTIFSRSEKKKLAEFQRTVQLINDLEPEIEKLSQDMLLKRISEIKSEISNGKKIDDYLVESFAMVREASKRTLGQRHFDVQLIGGMVLHNGGISEMKTGEGKTLVSTLAAFLNSLSGKGVHIVTVNDYLARRDAEWMGSIFNYLGLSVGCLTNDTEGREKRKEQYACDITYGTNNEFGFDYLRDNLRVLKQNIVQRDHNFCIVDEVDSILIDESRTPLIISGKIEDKTTLYNSINKIIPFLNDDDFEIDEKTKTANLTDAGNDKAEKILKERNIISEGTLYDISNVAVVHHINQALRANKLFEKDRDYIVKSGSVVIVDEFTGRTMEGRRYGDGLHQAIEAKENVKVQNESQTLASITYQNYFRLYNKISGMTGTALTEAEEFGDIYNLSVFEIPTNIPVSRIDNEDEIYRTAEEKYDAIIEQIKICNEKSQPVLVGTTSIDKSEKISRKLRNNNIKHEVLNAKHHEQEAKIIANAGEPGAVTIATNMAGRGTDIVLGGNEEDASFREKVLSLGGLHVIGTERHESRRVDNQLRGRSGRQGDPGSSQFFLSLEDSLMKIFAPERVKNLMQSIGGMKKGESIEHRMLTGAIERAQRRVEGRNFDLRKRILEFDDVLNEQRQVIYSQREEILQEDDLTELIDSMRFNEIADLVYSFLPPSSVESQWQTDKLKNSLSSDFAFEFDPAQFLDDEKNNQDTLIDEIVNQLKNKYLEKRIEYSEVLPGLEKQIVLQVIDISWKNHINALEYLRQNIGFRSYAGKDPRLEYKREAFEMFEGLLTNINAEAIKFLSKIQINKEEQTAQESSVIKNTISHKEEIQSAFDSPQEQVNKNKSEPNEEFSGNRRMRRLQAKAKRKKRK